MTSDQQSNSGFDVDFGSGHSKETVPNKSVLRAYAEARMQRTDAQKKFIKNGSRTNADARELADALIDFEKIRSGRMWKAADADHLIKRYREALATDPSKIDLAQFSAHPNPLSRFEFRKPRLPPDHRHDHPSEKIDPKTTGWYYEKYFDYAGQTSTTMLTFERFNDPTLGGDVAGSIRNAGPQDHVSLIAETGRWMSYTPDRTGYINAACAFRMSYRILRRHINPGTAPDYAVGLQSIDGSVGILSGNDFIGRQLIQMKASIYSGDGVSGTPEINDRVDDQEGIFMMYGNLRVEQGEEIKVMIGMRVKTYFGVQNIAAGGAAEIRAYPDAFAIGILDTIPETPPPQW